MTHPSIRVGRVVCAAASLAALVYIPASSGDVPGFTIANFFSYFTVLSNVLAVVVLGVGGALDPQSPRWDAFRGSVVTYMVITGIVYAVLLAEVDVNVRDPWTNNVLHRIVPLAILLDWLIAPARTAISNRTALSWLWFPVAYGVYSLIRGPIVEWYPYPFLDPRTQGYVALGIGLIVLIGGFVLIAMAIANLGELAGRRRSARAR
ncbi:hypothetical protein GCM10007304_22950 [Rhodococcoides trifolii]|uniref:Pr6Pr family membrane protein n=1 Tax=Rhodococcoides trifolii TaxID=908250 RepID=A0A917D492_9NOCA|nr:Pr6Pr family membrane protein [Rhodococcus trifolii]GGG08270.1 hypothetical protein GCM10007304_22950 [Rhodococcus trifolii]